MIVLGLLGALSAGDTPQGNMPSVLPPLQRPTGRGGPDPSCTLPRVVVGQPVPTEVQEMARGVTKVRILRRGDQATMDLIPDRRNIHVDDKGNVTHITCG